MPILEPILEPTPGVSMPILGPIIQADSEPVNADHISLAPDGHRNRLAFIGIERLGVGQRIGPRIGVDRLRVGLSIGIKRLGVGLRIGPRISIDRPGISPKMSSTFDIDSLGIRLKVGQSFTCRSHFIGTRLTIFSVADILSPTNIVFGDQHF